MKILFLKKGPLAVLFYFLSLNIASAETAYFSNLYSEQVKPIALRALDPISLRLLFYGTATTLAARPNDDSMRSQWAEHKKMSAATSEIGDFLGTGIPAGLLALTQYYGWDEQGGAHHFRALLSTAVVTQTMKFGFGRGRPGSNANHESFPSGHTSTTFASATVLSYTYGWQVGVLAYPLAILTACSRLSDDVHWFSDVVGGAVVGIWLGRASYLKDEKSEDQFSIVPILNSEYLGAQMEFRF